MGAKEPWFSAVMARKKKRFKDYFQAEKYYLLKAGKAFGEHYPEASHLGLGPERSDPFVERLLEGFAFLAGRIHARLDDEMTEYTQALLTLLYPHFLRPIPSMCIVEFAPKAHVLQGTMVLDKEKLEIQSKKIPVEEDLVSCRFEARWPVSLQPLSLEGVTFPDDRRVELTFSLENGVDYQKLDLSTLRLYLSNKVKAPTMHVYLTRYVADMRLWADEGRAEPLDFEWPAQQRIRPVGLERRLLPGTRYLPAGFQLLQEYLCCRDQFWFVDVEGLDRFKSFTPKKSFTLEITFKKSYPRDKRFMKDDLRLHCAPVVNLFRHYAHSISREGLASEYPLILEDWDNKAVYDLEWVKGTDKEDTERIYTPFFTFRHAGTHQTERASYYIARRRMGPSGQKRGAEHEESIYLEFGGEDEDIAFPENIEIQARCTDRNIPLDLQGDWIDPDTSNIPKIVAPTPRTRPALMLYPPVERQEDFRWKLISHWALNYLSVARPEALRGLLELYDWEQERQRKGFNKLLRDGIRDVKHKPKEIVSDARWKGGQIVRHAGVVRGTEVTIVVDEENDFYRDEGNLCLFGLVLSTFFSMYATINSFVHLIIKTHPGGNRFEWPPPWEQGDDGLPGQGEKGIV